MYLNWILTTFPRSTPALLSALLSVLVLVLVVGSGSTCSSDVALANSSALLCLIASATARSSASASSLVRRASSVQSCVRVY